MTTVNSISGGKTSGYMAIHYPADVEIFACVCIDAPECAPKDPTVLKYSLDKLNGNFLATAENDKTLKVMMDIEQIIGKEIVWVRGKSFDQILRENSLFPSWNRRYCTQELKIIPICEYIYPRYGKVNMQIGFRGDEYERIIKSNAKEEVFKMAKSCQVSSKRKNWGVIDWREKSFPLRSTYHFQIIKWWKDNFPGVDFPRISNCVWCHHKPHAILKQMWFETPEKMAWLVRQELIKLKKYPKRKLRFWKDSGPAISDIIKMNFTEEIDFQDFTMCNSGVCTD